MMSPGQKKSQMVHPSRQVFSSGMISPFSSDVKGKYLEIEKQRKKERKAAGGSDRLLTCDRRVVDYVPVSHNAVSGDGSWGSWRAPMSETQSRKLGGWLDCPCA